MTANQIEIALAKKHSEDFFITECKNGSTWFSRHLRMDAIAIKKSWANPCVTAYEVKISRNDFLRDDKWPGYLEYCNRFYFACPEHLIEKSDIPDSRVGLVWIYESGACRTVKTVPVRPTEIPGDFFKYILFSRLDGDRIPFYSTQAEYAKDFILHKKDARELGYHFSSALIKRCAELETQIQEKNDSKIGIKAQKYDELCEILHKHGIQSWWGGDLPKRVDEAFTEIQEERAKIDLFDRILPAAQKIVEFGKYGDQT